jgi:LemA protein
MSRGAKIAIAIGVVALIVYLLLLSPYNTLVSLDETVAKAKADVEVTLQRRLDLIPNLVETVKGYAAHEKETLEAVIAARKQVADAPDLPAKLAANQGLTGALGRLLLVVERYPELKANQNFRMLQDQLEGTENRIAVARNRYNQAVLDYNTAIRRFPAVILAKLMGFEAKKAFEAQPAAQAAPQVKFK